MISSPILKMFVGHILLVNYLLSICFIQIAASNNNELGKEEDNGLGLNVFKERVKRGEETQGSTPLIIIIVILVLLSALLVGCSVLSCYFYNRYKSTKALLIMQVDELSKTRLINHSLEARISKMIKKDIAKDIAEMEKSEKMKRKATGEEDEVYKVKEDKNKEGKDTSRMAFI
uniref:Uncharacterized protein n=1 Tax=Meloidogyne enterolobii TaxID=390850 RepID=A0A6V7U984_MELEN|nr:unnamed protein product [Meloidogyne enterolobii]